MQLAEFDNIVTSKEEEITALNNRLHVQSPMSPSLSSVEDLPNNPDDMPYVLPVKSQLQRGKAPLIEPFTGKNTDICLDGYMV